jgi:peroxin-10
MQHEKKYDIIKSQEKDYEQCNRLARTMQELLELSLSSRSPQLSARLMSSFVKYSHIVSQAVYYAATSLCGKQTIGQECYNLLYYDPATKTIPTRLRLLLLVCAKLGMSALALVEFRSWLLRNKWQFVIYYVIRRVLLYLTRLNQVLFFAGRLDTYNTIENRLLAVEQRTIGNGNDDDVKRRRSTHKRFAVLQACLIALGLINEAKKATKLIRHLSKIGRDRVKSDEQDKGDDTGDEKAATSASNDERVAKCSLCLDRLNEPTATICGHVFCWRCICVHIVKSQEYAASLTCPTCKASFQPSQIIRLFNFN